MSDLDAEWMQYLLSQSGMSVVVPTSPLCHSYGVHPIKKTGISDDKSYRQVDSPNPDNATNDGIEPLNSSSVPMSPITSPKTNERKPTTLDMEPPLLPPSSTQVGQVNPNMELVISTKTKVLFLNRSVDIHSLFWDIPILDYWIPCEGVLKKQIKVVSNSPEEFASYQERLHGVRYYKENIIKQINNPTARSIKFKDERKITIGLSRKDIVAYRGKAKNAFYNCFALIVRFRDTTDEATLGRAFREVHIKVFNTGKMEIPGIVHYTILEKVKAMVLDILQPHVDTPLTFVENSHEDHVLINSNFNCGFFVNRERFHSILSSEKYDIESSYDPCSYPGVKCKFYYNHVLGFDKMRQNGRILEEDRALKMSELTDSKKYTEVSFMIFRTGSGLIVGNCTEKVLRFIFEFIKEILVAEYEHICILSENPIVKNKRPRLRKRVISYTSDYHNTVMQTDD